MVQQDVASDGKASLVVLALGLTLFLPLFHLGCAVPQWRDSLVVQGNIPGARAPAEIDFLGEKLGYLDALVKAGGREYRFFFPATPACRELLSGDVSPQYGTTGRAGFLSAGDLRCEPAGVLHLMQWRDTSGRRSGEGIRREQASYEVYKRGDGLVLARGRFPLVSRLGIESGYRVVVIIPDNEACADVLNSSTASMEFRQTGKVPITLLSGEVPCEMLGVIYDSEPASSPP